MSKKILISGFVSDNFLEISSYMEELNICKTKIEEKILNMLNVAISSENLIQSAYGFKIKEIYHDLLQDQDFNKNDEIKYYIANQKLLYIAEDLLRLDDNILFILFYENPIEILRQKIFSTHKFCFKEILNNWFAYNNFMLEIYNKNKDKCILINYKNYHSVLNKYLNRQYDNNVIERVYNKDNNCVYKNNKLFNFLLHILIKNNYWFINDSYEKLEKLSLNPDCEKNIFSKNIEEEIIDLNNIIQNNTILKNKNEVLLDFIFEMQEDIERLYFDNQELRKMSDGQFVNQIIQDKSSRIRSANNQLIFQFRYGMAKTRIQNQLSYRLGQTMIMNSKNFIGVVFMPILLLSTLIVFKQEQKAYVDRISKDPSLKLPLLEEYPDYREAIKVKKHLSYKLGEAIIVQFKRWYKGGLFILPFALVKIYREHKGRYAN